MKQKISKQMGSGQIAVTEEIDTPKGIVNFLEKRNGLSKFNYKSRYSVTELVGCQRKSLY